MTKGRLEVERRKHPRISLSAKVDIKWTFSRRKELGQVGNISEEGIRIFSNEFAKKGDRMVLTLELIKDQPIVVDATVVWVRQAKAVQPNSSFRYVLGVKFLGLHKKNRGVIASFVSKLLGS